jgi:alpha-glucan,water dikinase
VGRGGEGDVGQRIRDEILVIQRNNTCKGGMMEEWHQKLHNNTSPDDVVICQV